MVSEFLHADIMYHGRCLEALTKAHNLFDKIDEEKEQEVSVTYLKYWRSMDNY
jgi:hypothetical protein